MDVDVYDDIANFDLGDEIDKLKTENKLLDEHIQSLESDIEKLTGTITQLKENQNHLVNNISSLYLTAKAEVDRKDRMIADLRIEIDNMHFRRLNVDFRFKRKEVDGVLEGNEPKKFKKASGDDTILERNASPVTEEICSNKHIEVKNVNVERLEKHTDDKGDENCSNDREVKSSDKDGTNRNDREKSTEDDRTRRFLDDRKEAEVYLKVVDRKTWMNNDNRRVDERDRRYYDDERWGNDRREDGTNYNVKYDLNNRQYDERDRRFDTRRRWTDERYYRSNNTSRHQTQNFDWNYSRYNERMHSERSRYGRRVTPPFEPPDIREFRNTFQHYREYNEANYREYNNTYMSEETQEFGSSSRDLESEMYKASCISENVKSVSRTSITENENEHKNKPIKKRLKMLDVMEEKIKRKRSSLSSIQNDIQKSPKSLLIDLDNFLVLSDINTDQSSDQMSSTSADKYIANEISDKKKLRDHKFNVPENQSKKNCSVKKSDEPEVSTKQSSTKHLKYEQKKQNIGSESSVSDEINLNKEIDSTSRKTTAEESPKKVLKKNNKPGEILEKNRSTKNINMNVVNKKHDIKKKDKNSFDKNVIVGRFKIPKIVVDNKHESKKENTMLLSKNIKAKNNDEKMIQSSTEYENDRSNICKNIDAYQKGSERGNTEKLQIDTLKLKANKNSTEESSQKCNVNNFGRKSKNLDLKNTSIKEHFAICTTPPELKKTYSDKEKFKKSQDCTNPINKDVRGKGNHKKNYDKSHSNIGKKPISPNEETGKVNKKELAKCHMEEEKKNNVTTDQKLENRQMKTKENCLVEKQFDPEVTSEVEKKKSNTEINDNEQSIQSSKVVGKKTINSAEMLDTKNKTSKIDDISKAIPKKREVTTAKDSHFKDKQNKSEKISNVQHLKVTDKEGTNKNEAVINTHKQTSNIKNEVEESKVKEDRSALKQTKQSVKVSLDKKTLDLQNTVLENNATENKEKSTICNKGMNKDNYKLQDNKAVTIHKQLIEDKTENLEGDAKNVNTTNIVRENSEEEYSSNKQKPEVVFDSKRTIQTQENGKSGNKNAIQKRNLRVVPEKNESKNTLVVVERNNGTNKTQDLQKSNIKKLKMEIKGPKSENPHNSTSCEDIHMTGIYSGGDQPSKESDDKTEDNTDMSKKRDNLLEMKNNQQNNVENLSPIRDPNPIKSPKSPEKIDKPKANSMESIYQKFNILIENHLKTSIEKNDTETESKKEVCTSNVYNSINMQDKKPDTNEIKNPQKENSPVDISTIIKTDNVFRDEINKSKIVTPVYNSDNKNIQTPDKTVPRRRITPTPVKDHKPICSFENILEKTSQSASFPSNLSVIASPLHLTHEGEIPVLHLEENHINNLPTESNINDKNILNLLDTMNLSNIEGDMTKFKNIPTETRSNSRDCSLNLSPIKRDTLTFENIIQTATSTPFVSKCQDVKNLDQHLENAENPTLVNDLTEGKNINTGLTTTTIISRRRRRCRLIIKD